MREPAKRLGFGSFTLDPAERLLLKDGRVVPLTPKAFDLLAVMVRNPGRLLSKDELIQEVWPDAFVEESNLAYNVFTIRKALGEGSDSGGCIETVPRRGYRFVAPVAPMDAGVPALASSASPAVGEDCSAGQPDGRVTVPGTGSRGIRFRGVAGPRTRTRPQSGSPCLARVVRGDGVIDRSDGSGVRSVPCKACVPRGRTFPDSRPYPTAGVEPLFNLSRRSLPGVHRCRDGWHRAALGAQPRCPRTRGGCRERTRRSPSLRPSGLPTANSLPTMPAANS